MTDEKEDILSHLDVLIKRLNETPTTDLTPDEFLSEKILDVIIGDLKDIKALITDNLN